MKDVTIEQAWGVLGRHGYEYQFEGNWVNLHPERVMVGRAITATMVPIRPDLNNVVNAQGKMEGRGGSQNNWVIQTVGDKDVVVVDLFGKVKDGTFVGDNLSTAVQSRGGSGLVIDGGIVLPEPSSIIAMIDDVPEIIREGKGDVSSLA